jgi:CheY-like chemotaxis protein
VVDDDKEYINSLEELLTSVGYKVLIAHNGKEALAHTEKTPPDAIILDVMMDSDTEVLRSAVLSAKQRL